MRKIKIFMGGDENGVDFPELSGMMEQAKNEGFEPFRDWKEFRKQVPVLNLNNSIVEFRGASTLVCLAKGGEVSLEAGALEIIYDLPHCRNDESDGGEHILLERQESIILGMKVKYENDPRIVFKT